MTFLTKDAIKHAAAQVDTNPPANYCGTQAHRRAWPQTG